MREDCLEQFGRAGDRTRLRSRRRGGFAFTLFVGGIGLDRSRPAGLYEPCRGRTGFRLVAREPVKTTRLLALKESGIDGVMIANPTPAALERIPTAFDCFDGPRRLIASALRALGGAQPPCRGLGGAMAPGSVEIGIERAGQRQRLDQAVVERAR